MAMRKSKSKYKILAIDTSCDETSVAVTANDWVLSNVVASQVNFHREYGGVVPNLAKRKHLEFINPAIKEALWRAHLKDINQVDALAVTVGPGLAPALEVGVNKAKDLALEYEKPLIAVNHMEGHLLSCLAKNSQGHGGVKLQFPIIGLLVSGGHTQLVLANAFGDYRILGETQDDAAGEAFDKVAKMLDLGYPGGPILTEMAKKGLPSKSEGEPKYDLPVPMEKKPGLDFSFSGLKTACLYFLKDIDLSKQPRQFYYDFAASFQYVVAQALIIKLQRALKKYPVNQVFLGGGVIKNVYIRRQIRKTARDFGLKTYIPYTDKMLTDNAAMIGVAAYYQAKRGDFVKDIKSIDRLPGLCF